jgi:serine/threonine protein kinase
MTKELRPAPPRNEQPLTRLAAEAQVTKAGGVVGYFLLTGQPPFLSESMLDILKHQMQTVPEPPSKRLGQPVSPEFEQPQLLCLAKTPADRPATANEFIAELDRLPTANSWTEAHAPYWWRRYISHLSISKLPDDATAAQQSSTIVLERANETTQQPPH